MLFLSFNTFKQIHPGPLLEFSWAQAMKNIYSFELTQLIEKLF